MKRITTMTLILLFLTSLANAQKDSFKFFAEVNKILNKHVYNNLIDYQAIKKNPQTLQIIVSELVQFDVQSLPNANAEKAFWINSYNILVIHSVVKYYPIKSPMDVKGFFDNHKHLVAGEKLTLNDIENIKLREKFQDPRIHFALVCAAKGCPPIINQAYIADKLEKQLDTRTSENLNNNNFIRVDTEAKKVYVSEIFKWYQEDFITDGMTVLQYINHYRTNKISENFSVDYYSYDWNLNEYKRTKTGHFIIESDNLQAYTPSILLLPGQFEVKQFNNLYTQTAFFNEDGDKVNLNERPTYFT